MAFYQYNSNSILTMMSSWMGTSPIHGDIVRYLICHHRLVQILSFTVMQSIHDDKKKSTLSSSSSPSANEPLKAFFYVMQRSHWVAATATVSVPMWTPPFVCIKPIHDDTFAIATAMWTPPFDCIKPIYWQRYHCHCRHSVWMNLKREPFNNSSRVRLLKYLHCIFPTKTSMIR